jgi:hypothetical protein
MCSLVERQGRARVGGQVIRDLAALAHPHRSQATRSQLRIAHRIGNGGMAEEVLDQPRVLRWLSNGASRVGAAERLISGARWAIWPFAGPSASTVVSA